MHAYVKKNAEYAKTICENWHFFILFMNFRHYM